MALSLDHTTYIIPPTSSSAHNYTRTTTQNTLDSHVHTIRGTTQNVSNRFFDKPFTTIVDPSTRAGASGEHSPVDALVPSIVAEYGIISGVDAGTLELRGTGDGVVVDEKIWKECRAATERANAIINDSDDSVLWFDKFGSNWIKSFGLFLFFSPFLNLLRLSSMRRQLQTFPRRIHSNDNQTSVVQNSWRIYKTVLTRMFKHDRTETLCAFSCESRHWMLSMLDPPDSVSPTTYSSRLALGNRNCFAFHTTNSPLPPPPPSHFISLPPNSRSHDWPRRRPSLPRSPSPAPSPQRRISSPIRR